jgi:hypothetical protein
MNGGFLNLLERMSGGVIYHCKFCRLQFYDRRKSAAEKPRPAEGQDLATPTE